MSDEDISKADDIARALERILMLRKELGDYVYNLDMFPGRQAAVKEYETACLNLVYAIREAAD